MQASRQSISTYSVRRRICSIALVLVSASLLSTGAGAAEELSFEADIRPILKTHCFHCHGEEGHREGELDVRLRRLLIEGGDSGAAIVPGKPRESLLWQRIHDGEMPPEDASERPSAEDLQTIEAWIAAGAPHLYDEPESLEELSPIAQEELKHWAYQPVRQPTPPRVSHPQLVRTAIDAFLLRKLEQQQLRFAPMASRFTLIRRLSFDLRGLPPTPEEIDRFIEDQEPGAYERLVDRWLDSPEYGERWGRHWLDVAGYADSEGYTDVDAERQHAWRYRDYVIRAFNENISYRQFLIEQLAGDELVPQPHNNLTPDQARLLTATGFLRTAPDGTGGTVPDPALARNEVIAQTMKIVTSTTLGLTVGCAQCHNHRYDPITQQDYYEFRAIFDPAFDWQNWQAPVRRRKSLYTDADRKRAAELEQQAKEVEARRTVRQQELIAATFEKQLLKVPENERQAVRAAAETAAKKRSNEQSELLKRYPAVNVTASSLYLYDKQAADELKRMADEAKAIRDSKPPEGYVRCLTESPQKIPESHLFYRGDHEQPKQQVRPAVLSALALNGFDYEIPINDSDLSTSGRRLALARWLTQDSHPLTARVFVNRVWMLHFGRGIVATPSDFGTLGQPPSHPELLDWLASRFVASGWDIKWLQRTILHSHVYRQASLTDEQTVQTDPDNLGLARFPVRRIEAEVLRDTLLAVAGRLNRKPYGPAVPVMADRVGRYVIGIENLNAGRPGAVIPMKGEDLRRTIYVQFRRSRPLSLLATFDLPRMEPNCERRSYSTVAPQSLTLMNGDFVMEQAQQLADRLQSQTTDKTELVSQLWLTVYAREPDTEEIAMAQQFLDQQYERFAGADDGQEKTADGNSKLRARAFSVLCHTLLGSNEFLYVD